jgi:DNA processing protein
MDETIARLAYLSDASGHSTKVGRLLHSSSHDISLDENVDRLFQEMEITVDDRVQPYLREIERMEADGISIVHFFSSDFPDALREIDDTPVILYLKGECRDFYSCIAISGSRNPSSRGHRAAREIAIELVGHGFTVVAGFARGVDQDAHQGALEAGGRTFAVLPSSIGDIYPKDHSRLAEEVVERGLLISEMSSLERMNRLSFIRRNRITTGLSSCLVIGESDGTGGTLQQFNIAKKQGRPVFAIRPDEKDRHAMKGFSRFTKDGAIPVDDGQDVIDQLAKASRGQLTLGEFKG